MLVGLLIPPRTIRTSSAVMKRFTMLTACSGFPASSPYRSWIFLPRTPPAPFTSSTTRSMASRSLWPYPAAPPVIGPKTPILIVSWANAVPATRSRIATDEIPRHIRLLMAVPPSRSSGRTSRSAGSGRDEIDLDDRAVEHDAGRRNDRHHRWIRHHPAIDAFEAAIVLGVQEIDVRVDDVLERGAAVVEQLLEVAQDVLGLDLDVRAVIGHPRVDAVHGSLEVGRDLAGQEEPVTRADGR